MTALSSTPKALFDLTDLTPVAHGNRRDVYLIPGHLVRQAKPVVLKVPRPDQARDDVKGSIRLRHRLFPGSALRVIRSEARYWQKISDLISGQETSAPIPAFYGFIETSAGTGSLWEAVFDSKGALAPTLEQLALQGEMGGTVAPLNDFVQFCYDQNLVAPDIKSANLVLAIRDGSSQIVLIDGFGDHRLFSMRSLSSVSNRNSLDRRFLKVARTTGLLYDEQIRRFSLP